VYNFNPNIRYLADATIVINIAKLEVANLSCRLAVILQLNKRRHGEFAATENENNILLTPES
jgi:hypothetical protein